MKSGVTTPSSELKESPTIFIYDLDFGRYGPSIETRSILSIFFKKFSILESSDMFAGQFVMIIISLFDRWMKSAMMSELDFFRHSLILAMCLWADFMINSAFDLVIGMMTSFLNGPLVVMFNFGFILPLLLFLTFNIFPTSLANKDGNASLTHKISLILDKRFVLEAWAYDFFMFEGLGTFWGTADIWRGGCCSNHSSLKDK